MIIIGSVAAKHWFPNFYRTPNDIDFIHTIKKTLILDEMKVESMCDPVMDYLKSINKNDTFLDVDLLLTLKMSHANWDIHWSKTMADIAWFQRQGVVSNDTVYHELVKLWEPIHGKKQVKMNVSNKEFFTPAVKRKYDHDWLHEQVKFGTVPMYQRILVQSDKPLCSEEKFDNLDWSEKLDCFFEEVLVIAIERFNLTKTSKKHERLIAINKAAKQLITTMTSGWFTCYMITHHYELTNHRDILLGHLDYVLEKL